MEGTSKDTERSPLSPSKQQTRGGPTPWDVEADISALFSKHSVEEVRQIEQKTRLDIERKKEDLRQMVGERYRDLIDAADSIMELRTGSEQIGESMGHLIQVCQSLQQTHFLKGLGGMRGPPTRNETHLIAAQMKLLGDAPEKMWLSLEGHRYLEATQLYLLARHTHSQLQLSLAKNTLVQRLWHTTASFKLTILECCRRHLQSSEQSMSAMLSCLCAIVMLEGCSLRHVFTQFLLAQKVAIQAVFHPTKQMHSSVKTQISEAVAAIQRSIVLIATIFCVRPGQGSSLLLKAVKDFTSKQKRDNLRGVVTDEVFSQLPQSVQGFVPTLRTAITEVPANDIHSSCQEWLSTCVCDVGQGVKQLLCHVTSVKGLSGIRDSLHRLLAESENTRATPTDSDKESWSDEWAALSDLVMGENICIWERFLQQLFFDRAKAILTKHFSTAEEHATKILLQLLNGLTSDPTLYSSDINVTSQLWVEDNSQAPGRVRDGGEGVEISTLSLKTKACTPSIYRFCQSVAEKLQIIVEDAGHYLQPMKLHPNQATVPPSGDFPFCLYGDHRGMQEFLQLSTNQCVTRFLSKIDQTVNELHSQLKLQQHEVSSNIADRLLVIARVCQSLSDFCPPLSLLSRGCKTTSTSATPGLRGRSRRTATSLSRRKEEDAETNTARQLLTVQSSSIHIIWADCCAQQFISQYQDQLLSSTELNALSSSLMWDEIMISEEAESGKKVTSLIKVPTQASVYVTSLLFAACQEISRIGGHAIERNVLLQFSGKCLRGVLEVHRAMLTSLGSGVAMPQNCALQLLFNVRFLCSILSSPKEMEEDTSKLQQSVLDQIHSLIDPFDLDVFTPYILSALERQLQRSTVLLGLLLALRGSSHLLSGHKPPPSSTQEKHIVIPLFPSTPRFPPLPISTSVQHASRLPPVHPQCSDEDVQAPRTFLETVSFFHHL